MLLALVDDSPSALFRELVGSAGLIGKDSVFWIEGIPSVVLIRAGRGVQRKDVGFYNGIAQAIDHGVDPNAEHVLMVVRVDVRRNGGSERSGLSVFADVDGQDTSKTDLELDAAILVEVVVPDVF